MATSAERQRKFRERRAQRGVVPVTVYVPEGAKAELLAVCRQLAEHGHLEWAACPLRDTRTGRLVRVR